MTNYEVVRELIDGTTGGKSKVYYSNKSLDLMADYLETRKWKFILTLNGYEVRVKVTDKRADTGDLLFYIGKDIYTSGMATAYSLCCGFTGGGDEVDEVWGLLKWWLPRSSIDTTLYNEKFKDINGYEWTIRVQVFKDGTRFYAQEKTRVIKDIVLVAPNTDKNALGDDGYPLNVIDSKKHLKRMIDR